MRDVKVSLVGYGIVGHGVVDVQNRKKKTLREMGAQGGRLPQQVPTSLSAADVDAPVGAGESRGALRGEGDGADHRVEARGVAASGADPDAADGGAALLRHLGDS